MFATPRSLMRALASRRPDTWGDIGAQLTIGNVRLDALGAFGTTQKGLARWVLKKVITPEMRLAIRLAKIPL